MAVRTRDEPRTHTAARAVDLWIPGQPQTEERARQGKNGWYTPSPTRKYRERVQDAWLSVGRPWLGDGALALQLGFSIAYAPSCLRKDGGLRKGAPTIPLGDWDNYGKAVCDALNGLLWVDDKQIVNSWVVKRFVRHPEWAGTRLTAFVESGPRS